MGVWALPACRACGAHHNTCTAVIQRTLPGPIQSASNAVSQQGATMNEARERRRKHFTVEEANAALPLVRAICEDLAELSREVIDRRERLSRLTGSRSSDARDIYREEVEEIERELEADTQRLYEYVDELRQLGVEPKNGPEGLVDFPSLMDGREVYLCWKLGEPEVLYWHELDAGFAGRQSLTADACVECGCDTELAAGENADHGHP